jgi:hypothetical protein
LPICPKYSVAGVIVQIQIDGIRVEKTGDQSPTGEFFFNIDAKLEEKKKTSQQVVLSFSISITTKPNIVKYGTTGTLTLEGNIKDINSRLEINPKTNVPEILSTVYQHVFSSIYLLSSVLSTPYPPPDLLPTTQEKIQIVPKTADVQTAQAQESKTTEKPATKDESKAPTAATT